MPSSKVILLVAGATGANGLCAVLNVDQVKHIARASASSLNASVTPSRLNAARGSANLVKEPFVIV